MNPAEAELINIDIDEIVKIYNFCNSHFVQVFIGSDHQYEIHIDGKGSYGSWITFFGALHGGINLYNKKVADDYLKINSLKK